MSKATNILQEQADISRITGTLYRLGVTDEQIKANAKPE